MAIFSVRVPDSAAARFDAAARSAGGRSALLRRLIGEAGDNESGLREQERGARNGGRFMVRLRPAEAQAIRLAAAGMSVSPSGWIAALVGRHVARRPSFPRAQEAILLAILAEVHRIGVNVNQIARALNTAVLEGRVLDLELQAVEDLRGELRAHLTGLREAFEGNLAYWKVGE